MKFKDAILRAGHQVVLDKLNGNIQTNSSRGRFRFQDSSTESELLTQLTAYSAAELELPGVLKCQIVVEDAACNFRIIGPIEPLTDAR
jgi:hypothetical protein